MPKLLFERWWDSGRKPFRIEAKRSRFALEQNTPVFPDQIQPVRPPGVLLLHSIIDSINNRWHQNVQLSDTGLRNLFALGLRSWIPEQNALLHVTLHLPDICRMGLGNVNHVESHLRLVQIVELVERGNLPAKWWSSIAAEYEDNRLSTPERSR